MLALRISNTATCFDCPTGTLWPFLCYGGDDRMSKGNDYGLPNVNDSWAAKFMFRFSLGLGSWPILRSFNLPAPG